MYTELIEKIIKAINAGRTDLAQFHLSNLLLTNDNKVDEEAKKELIDAIPASKVVIGTQLGLRVGYLEIDGERYYFA